MDNKDDTTNEEIKKTEKPLIFFNDAPLYKNDNNTQQLNINDTMQEQNNSISDSKTPLEKMISTIDENIQEMDISNAEQIENTVLNYVKLLDPADKYYIKYQHVYDNGEKYISYLKSQEYIQYKKDRKALESKYSNNKRYTVEVTKKKVIVYKKDQDGNTDKSSKLDELTRPTYIYLTEIFDKSHKNITQIRLKLKAQYNQYINKSFISLETKNKFIKQRESMINKLNDFYSIQYFYNKINGIIQTEKVVSLPKLVNYYSENSQEIVPRVSAQNISVAPDDLKLLYDNGSKKLDLYNKIQEILIANEPSQKTELNTLIKQYINFDTENQQELLYKIEKKKTHHLINYMVIPHGISMPSDNSIISPRDLRPFFAMRKNSNSQ